MAAGQCSAIKGQTQSVEIDYTGAGPLRSPRGPEPRMTEFVPQAIEGSVLASDGQDVARLEASVRGD